MRVELRHGNAITEVLLENLDPNPFSSRVDSPQLDDLVESLTKYGQLSPIKVRTSPLESARYQIIFGHRRVDAARRLGWKSIRVEVEEIEDNKLAIYALTENLERSEFSDYEIGRHILSLSEKFKYSQEEIAKLIGRSNSYVCEHVQLVRLFDSPTLANEQEEVKEVLHKLTVRQGRILSREPDLVQRLRIAKFCVSENLGLKEMEKLVGHPRAASSREMSRNLHLPDRGRSNDIRLISDMINSFVTATHKKDLGSLVSYRAPKSYSLLHNFAPHEILDAEGANELDFKIFKNVEEIDEDIDGLKIYVFGRFAYAVFFDSYKIRKYGKWSKGKSRATFIFRKIDKSWYIVHEHWSPAQYEDSELLSLSPGIVGPTIKGWSNNCLGVNTEEL
jgi:ParB family transcriptional regulator, chromosome partitioning protein